MKTKMSNIIKKITEYPENYKIYPEPTVWTAAKEIFNQIDLSQPPRDYHAEYDYTGEVLFCQATMEVVPPTTPEEARKRCHWHQARVMAPLYIEYKKLEERFNQACEMLINKAEPKLEEYRELAQKCAELENYIDQRRPIHEQTREELLRKEEEIVSLKGRIKYRDELLKKAYDLLKTNSTSDAFKLLAKIDELNKE